VTTPSGDEYYLIPREDVFGIFPDLIARLEVMLNFTAVFYKSKDGDYGNLINGSFTGAIQALLKVNATRKKPFC